jgi:pSer/pThr/pTyr-binding forkhead associated (FHA) protein
MSDRLAKLESHIEQIVEGTFTRLLAGRLQPRELAVRLARAMEDFSIPGPKDSKIAPTHYRVRLNPDDAEALKATSPSLVSGLSAHLLIFARELDLVLLTRPTVTLEADPHVESNDMIVQAIGDPNDTTRPMPLSEAEKQESSRAPKAFVIINGNKHVPMEKSVVTIGRKLNNVIILDDPRVSRHHAQIRQRYGKWVLYDLGSAGGTFVNNQQVEECVLRAGDVITLAGTTLIYGEEESSPNSDDSRGTKPMPARKDETPAPKER